MLIHSRFRVHGAGQVFPYVGYNARSAKRQAATLPQQGHEAVHMCIVSLIALLLIMGEWGGGGEVVFFEFISPVGYSKNTVELHLVLTSETLFLKRLDADVAIPSN